jgi:Fe-Mn family superoxide dismutase
MSPNGGGDPTGAVADAINSAFGSFEQMKAEFTKAAVTRFGSGWAWLSVSADGSLAISSTPNQDNPLMDGSGSPILAVDVWEHAYYKKFGPGRGDYLASWWNVVNWDTVNELYQSAHQ